MGDDFRVRFGCERVTFLLQFFLEFEIILDNAVVDNDDFSGAVAMRVGILLSRTAMRCPARMTDAVSAIKRRFGDDLFEIAELAWGAADLQVAVLPYDGDARGIVATIFELAKAFYENSAQRNRAVVARQSLNDFEAILFDDWVCKHFLGNAIELFLRFIAAPAIEIEDKEFPLADIFYGCITQPRKGVLDCLPLGIKYRTFWHYPDVSFHGVSIALPPSALCSVPSGSIFETHLHDADQLFLMKTHSRCVRVLLAQRGMKHGWIIGGEHHGNTMAQEPRERMFLDSWIGAPKLPGEGARFQVAPGAYFKRDFSFREQVHQLRVVDRRDTMTNALRAK